MTSRLERLLRPTSLAFIGGAAATAAIEQCQRLEFEGDMVAVHPTRTDIGGIRTVKTVDDIGWPPDAAFVGVNRELTVDTVRQLAEIETGAAVLYASGFDEAGAEGRRLQQRLTAAAGSMPIVGPNCYGTLSGVTGAALWPDQQGLRRVERGLAIVTQSGNIGLNLTMAERGIDIAHVVTLGNQSDVGIEECLGALVLDESVTGIVLHIEALHDVASFRDAVDVAHQRRIPVVAMKSGRTTTAAAIAASHTSSMVGDDDAYQGLFDRIGVTRVRSIPDLLDTTHLLGTLGPLPGPRVVSLSCSGGEASLVADAADGTDLRFEPFDPDHEAAIRATLSDLVSITNPLDYHTFIWGDHERLTACFTAVLDGPLDAALLVLDYPGPGLDHSSWEPTLDAFANATRATGTPGVVCSTLAENLPTDTRRRAHALGLATIGDLGGALRGIEAAVRLGQRRETVPPLGAPASQQNAPMIVSEAVSKEILEEHGIVTPTRWTGAIGQAGEHADEVGYPAVLKASGIVHKTEVGGVVLDLADREAVEQAATVMADSVDTVMLESQVTGTVAELLVNVRRCAPVGWLLTIGAGGTRVEVLNDTVSMLLPCSDAALRVQMEKLAMWPLLTGHRGQPCAAVDAVAELVMHLTQLISSPDSDVVEIEINPVIVTEHDAIAADALITKETP